MIAFEVHIEELLLPESFVTMATGVGFFSSVCSFMHDHMALLSASVFTLVTLIAFLVLMRLLMLDEGISLMEHSITITTLSS